MYHLFFTHHKDPVTSWSFRRNSINVPAASGTRFDHDPWTGYPRIQYTRLVVVVVVIVLVVVVVVVVVGIVVKVAAVAVCFI
jgi:hypothetical protein